MLYGRTFTRDFFTYLFSYTKYTVTLFILFSSNQVTAQKLGLLLIDSLSQEVQRAKPDTNKAFLLTRLGFAYNGINSNEGLKFTNMGLDLSRKLNWDHGIAEAYNILGSLYLDAGNQQKALEYWNQGKDIFDKLHDKKGALKIIGNIGICYNYQGYYLKSVEYFFIALKYAEEIGDTYSVALNLGNIGATYEYIKNYDKALEYDLKALNMSEKLHDTIGQAILLENIGNLYGDLKNNPVAYQYYFMALALCDKIGILKDKAEILYNIGSLYSKDSEIERSLDYCFQAIQVGNKAGSSALVESNALGVIGIDYLLTAEGVTRKTKNPDSAGSKRINELNSFEKSQLINKAISFLKTSIDSGLKTNNLNGLVTSYQYLSKALKLHGDYQGALDFEYKFIEFKDSVFSLESKVKITNLETQREVELKDKQIIIDKLEVAKKRNERIYFIVGIVLLLVVITIVIRNMRLSAAKELSENKLNAFQARMNPHFIFNSLSSIQSLVMNNENEASIDYLSEFATLMRQILDSSAKSKVLLKTEIDMLRSYIELEHLRFDCFTWDIHIAEGVSEDTVEVPGMIVQPFVENAILHGLIPKGENGLLSISFERENKQIICTIDDNGIGREKSAELNSRRNKSRQSHGTSIAVNRLTLLNDKKRGLVNKVTYIDKVENGIATGTKVIIQIPVL